MKKIIFLTSTLLLIFSCKQSAQETGKNGTTTPSGFLYSKTLTDGFTAKYYGQNDHTDNRIDSVLTYTTQSALFSKEFFTDGDIVKTEYFDSDGKLSSQHINVSGHLANNYSIDQLIVTYDPDGRVAEKGFQGTYNGTGVPVETWYKYENGALKQKIYYHNDVSGKDYIRYRNYDHGEMTSESYSNNHILYESDSIPLSLKQYEERLR